jgi:hypothetical protein
MSIKFRRRRWGEELEVENSKIKVAFIFLTVKQVVCRRGYTVFAESSLQEYLIRSLCKGDLLLFV